MPSHSCFPLAVARTRLGQTPMFCSACCSCCAQGYFTHGKTLSSWEGGEGSREEHGDSVGKRGKIFSHCPGSPKRRRHTNPSIPRRQSPALGNESSSPQPPPTGKSQAGVGSHATPAISGYCHLSPDGEEQDCTVPSLSHLAICKLTHAACTVT